MKVLKEHHFYSKNNKKQYEPQNNHISCIRQRANIKKQPRSLKSKERQAPQKRSEDCINVAV